MWTVIFRVKLTQAIAQLAIERAAASFSEQLSAEPQCLKHGGGGRGQGGLRSRAGPNRGSPGGSPSSFECRAAWKAFIHFLFMVLKLFDIWKLVFACWCDLIRFWLQNTICLEPYLFRALFLTQLSTLHGISYRFICGSDKCSHYWVTVASGTKMSTSCHLAHLIYSF